MKAFTSDDPEAKSTDFVAENIAKFKRLFPDLITEGAGGTSVNIDVLKSLVGDQTVADTDEKYGLAWHGKRRARQLALVPSTGTLLPCIEDSVGWDDTQNLMIEGDNLEVLKLLQKSYSGKVKMIYIDPPYNTGGDFVYADSFADNIRNYMDLTGQIEGGLNVSSNTETSGRFHTNWLNMMYPRIKLARNLLRQDGVVFISIDDNEIDNLLKICREIFGDENYCGSFIWEKKKKPSFLNANMGSVTDYIVAFARNRAMSPPFAAGKVEDGKKYPFNNAGNGIKTLVFPPASVRFTFEDQTVQPQDMSGGNIHTKLLNEVVVENGTNRNEFRLEGEWRYSQSKLDEFVASGAEILISKIPFRPNYINRSGELKKTANLLSHRTNGVPTNEDATSEIRDLFGADIMSHPKPSGLIQYLVRAVTGEEDIIMDFFAGSGTTAHGVWRQCADDGLERRFVLVQLPEALAADDAAAKDALKLCRNLGVPPNIAEVCKERLRRTANTFRDQLTHRELDLGFKVFRLAESNVKEWNPRRESIAETLDDVVENLRAERLPEDLLYELLLKLGFELTTRIERFSCASFEIACIGSGTLMACLAERITKSDAEQLGDEIARLHRRFKPAGGSVVVFRDSAFEDDVTKANLSEILSQAGVERVRSL